MVWLKIKTKLVEYLAVCVYLSLV